MDPFGALQYACGLAWRETGAGEPLVLLHGGSGSRSHWIRNVPALATRFRVVTVDLPGFGESSTPARAMTPDDYVGWVASALWERFADRPFCATAFSFGAALLAASLRRHPFRVRRLALVAPGGFGRPTGRRLDLVPMPASGAATERERREVVATNLGRVMLARPPSPHDEAVDLQLANLERARYDSRAISLADSLTTDLAMQDVPVLAVWGDADALAWPSLDERIATLVEAVPRTRVLRVPDGGHWIQYEVSDAVNRALVAFHEGED